jgi:hypothetical protein
VAAFNVTGWEQTSLQGTGPYLSRATVTKTFRGDLEGTSEADLLMCQADPKKLGEGEGYVASEQFTGRLGGREGSFVIQHWGISGAGGAQQNGGHVVPGSGTGNLAGLSGRVAITVDAEGAHRITLEYEFLER